MNAASTVHNFAPGCTSVSHPPGTSLFHLSFPLKMGTLESLPPQGRRWPMLRAPSLSALVESFLSTLVSPLVAASLLLHLPPTLGQQSSAVLFPKE